MFKNYDNSPADPGDHINDILWKGPERNVEVSDVYYYIYIIDYILVGVFRIPIILRVLHSRSLIFKVRESHPASEQIIPQDKRYVSSVLFQIP